jgi:hypothetical protein
MIPGKYFREADNICKCTVLFYKSVTMLTRLLSVIADRVNLSVSIRLTVTPPSNITIIDK